jgi:hypothetical protein
MSATYLAPRMTDDVTELDAVDSEWAFAALVAALLGIAVAVVIYICTVCDARSFNSCYHAVKDYFNGGC